MTHINNISHHFLRTVLCLALMLGFSLAALAQTALPTWKASEAVKPLGSGTSEDPYIVATAENLFWISLNVGKSGAEKSGSRDKYYVQTDDIDLSGKEWMPIGNYSAGGFYGNYDGQGHKITGMTVDWGSYALALNSPTNKADGNMVRTNANNYAYGLFGWFGGKVENLVIEGANIIRSNVGTADLSNDFRIGVLAGSVSDSIEGGTNSITIKNIIVRNSAITDSGKDFSKAQAYFVGGLIGDVNSGNYSSYSTVKSNISISNVYVGTNIDLSETNISGTGSDGKGHQYNVGGIVGRLRYVKRNHVPTKAIYTGSINAPMGITGPIYGFARVNTGATQSYDNFIKGYDGEFQTGGTLTDEIYYHDYTVRGTEFTASKPAPSTNGSYTFRTLKSIEDETQYTYDDEGLKMFQGVNKGNYLDDAAAAQSAANSFNTNLNGFSWDIAASDRPMTRDYDVNISISHPNHKTYTVSYTTTRPVKTGYSIKWYYSKKSGTNLTHELLTTADGLNADGTVTWFKTEDYTLTAVLYDGTQRIETKSIPAKGVKLVVDVDDTTLPYHVTAQLKHTDDTDVTNETLTFNWRTDVTSQSNVNYYKTGTATTDATGATKFTLPLAVWMDTRLTVSLAFEGLEFTDTKTLTKKVTKGNSILALVPAGETVDRFHYLLTIKDNSDPTPLALSSAEGITVSVTNVKIGSKDVTSNTTYNIGETSDVPDHHFYVDVLNPSNSVRTMVVRITDSYGEYRDLDAVTIPAITQNLAQEGNTYKVAPTLTNGGTTYNFTYADSDVDNLDWKMTGNGQQVPLTAETISANKQQITINTVYIFDRTLTFKYTDAYGNASEASVVIPGVQCNISLALTDFFPDATKPNTPQPYHATVELRNKAAVLLENNEYDVTIELQQKSNSTVLKTWTTDLAHFEFDVPFTNVEAKLKITARSKAAGNLGEVVYEEVLDNYLYFGKRRNDDHELPIDFTLVVMDKSGNDNDESNDKYLEIPGMTYRWFIEDGNAKVYDGIGGVQESQTVLIPIPTFYGSNRYLRAFAQHENLLNGEIEMGSKYHIGYKILPVYKYAKTGGYYHFYGMDADDITQQVDDNITVRLRFWDATNDTITGAKGQHPTSLFGLTYSHELRNTSTNSGNNTITSKRIYTHGEVMDGGHVFYEFHFPYPTLDPLYISWNMKDVYDSNSGRGYTGNQYNFNLQTVPSIVAGTSADPSVKKFDLSMVYATSDLETQAEGKQLTVFNGMTFDWKLVDAASGKELPGLTVDDTGRSVTVGRSNAERKLQCTITDFYKTQKTVEYILEADETALSLAVDGNNIEVEIDGSNDLSGKGYTFTSWTMVNEALEPLNIDHLTNKTASSTAANITIDQTFIPRILLANYTKDGETGYVYYYIDPLDSYGIDGTALPYKAAINGVTEDLTTTYADKTFTWNILYDDGQKQTVDGDTLTSTNISRPTVNATYTLVIHDAYGDWTETVRKVNDSRTLAVNADSDGNLVASFVGYVPGEGTWLWRGLTGDISNDITKGYVLSSSTELQEINSTNDNYDVYSVVWTSADGNNVLVGYWTKKNVIYVFNKAHSQKMKSGRYTDIVKKYPDGNDVNNGRTPYTAVQTMKRAYALLDADKSDEKNMIVVMGYLGDNQYLTQTGTSSKKMLPKDEYKKNATITGTYGEIVNEGTLMLNGNGDTRGINGATTFANITLNGLIYDTTNSKYVEGHLFLYCNLNDLTIGNNVKVEDYQDLSSGNGQITGTKTPHITVVGGFHQNDNPPLEYPSGNAVPGRTTLTFQSGNWGRIIASARNNGQNDVSNNVFGHPDNPHRVNVYVAIKHTIGTDGVERKNEYTPNKNYDYDIGLLVGGQTDGTVFVDSKLYMYSGTVGRFISGNISYGRKAKDDAFPSDSFFGSTELTMDGGEIKELVGGTQGRFGIDAGSAEAAKICEAYFYGRSILNINSGVIGSIAANGSLTGNIYGAGAGGVTGLGDDTYNTNDTRIPYCTDAKDAYNRTVIAYGDYNTAKGKMPKMKMDTEDEKLEAGTDGKRNILDLAKSYCEVNINGGTINGNVFGGGYGYSNDIKTIYALDQAGNLYGNSYVNITGGTIKGNVYGGGAGASEYSRMATDSITNVKQYTTVDWEAKAKAFEDLANIFGDTHVTISGGIIEGKVFAGSKGIGGFPKMATLYGNTNLTIENKELSDNTTRVPVINNNIYGGSELGRIEGHTNVAINGGAIGNCIFGGSEGVEKDKTENGVAYKKTTAYINGNTNLTITGGTYFTAEHAAKISADKRLAAADRTFNIYGGGYNNCIIEGNTNVTIKKSLLSSHRCLIEPDPKDATKTRSFEDCVNDETYRKFSLYGAGRGELTDVKGHAILNVNIEGGANAPSSRPVDVANGQQFFMIAGGGMAGHVWKDTKVTLDGNVFARRVYGGGMYGNVLGEANITVRRGSYYGVFGGGLLGNVQGNANLVIGTKAGLDPVTGTTTPADDAADANRNLYIYNNVYGGNDVSGCTGYETTDSLWNDGNYQLIEGLSADNPFVNIKGKENFVLTEDDAKHHYLFEHWSELNNGKPYYRHLIRASEAKGVDMKIYGGKILGDVFGAGNGNHTGYYVPNSAVSEHHNPGEIRRMMFYEGLPYHYRVNKKDKNSYVEEDPDYNESKNTYTGTLKSVLDPTIREQYGLYEYRPRVGKVVMHIGGNSEHDRVYIGGDVFGGGHACTIGKYDPSRDVLTDPLKFLGGGSLKMNFGSHVTVKDAVYMGSRGRIIGEQTTVQPDNVYDDTKLNSDYDYHYYDPEQNKYLLGFPNTLEGRMRFHAYMQLVNMDATTELTFKDQIDNSESTDVHWGSFYAGGARGSMTRYIDGTAAHPAYEYTLPAGLTVEYRVVGGSEDAEITYYDYTEKTGENAFKYIDDTKPLFTFKGGIVYDEHTDGHFGGGQVHWVGWENSSDETVAPKDTLVGDEDPRGSLVVMKLNVNCQFDPQKAKAVNDDYVLKYSRMPDSGEVSDDGEQYWGGLVYGGCYNSGITNGSVEVTCTGSLLGKVDEDFKTDFQKYLKASSLRRNVARVYGGGFGKSSTILGNTKVTLDGSFRGFNIFGGGMMGNVIGGTEINVQGGSLVYNAVYGGGMLGNIGLPADDYLVTEKDENDNDVVKNIYKDLYAKGTHLNLISGGVDRVYGGAFSGNVYGGTHITASDEKAVEAAGETGDAMPTRLMVGSIYGGNDVTGEIHKDAATGLATYITVDERPSAKKTAGNRYFLGSESQTEPGKYYAGYPMIGTIYGAGNGNMVDYIKGVTIDRENNCYNGGRIHIANGNGADYNVYDLGVDRKPLPDVETTKVDIKGGTIINVYGGGSMCTATENDNIIIEYTDTVARAAFLSSQNDEMTWGVLRLFEDLQKSEVTTEVGDYTRFSHQIYRVFGGNNLMDMAIQPTWDLRRGHVFSVYSGGNFGKMTYPDGLSLTVESDDIHIETIYGGGRVGDIDAGTIFAADEYGATLNIKKGLIGDVYGGNNVAGNVRNGTNVNISGAISGNVYGSGNGNYIYLYDYDGTHGDPLYPGQITEGYNANYGGRYFILPPKVAYTEEEEVDGNIVKTPVYFGHEDNEGNMVISDEEKILAINSYRPNVDKSYLNIEGTDTGDGHVYITGNAYCGGNSSTVLFDPDQPNGGNIKFHIGDHVTIAGVFLGSNGEGLANSYNITYLGNLNGIDDWNKDNDIATVFTDKTKLHYNDQLAYEPSAESGKLLYPNLLSLYMRAVEVTALPTSFTLPTDATDAHIGNFCLGGNRGSMMTDKPINMTLPENLVIFGSVVGGCYNSRVEYGEAGNRAVALGGMTRPLSTGTSKVNLTVKSKFRPWRMQFDPVTHKVSLVNDRVDVAGRYVPDSEAQPDSVYSYSEGLCNIFGGCFTSGRTVGDINIDIYSDVLGYYENNKNWDAVETVNGVTRRKAVDRSFMKNNVAQRRTAYALTGAGYGAKTEVEGDVHLRMLPSTHHPSVLTIFAGSHDGLHVGNSTVEVRDGMVFSNLYGGSRAAYKYGSSEIIVGYPKYYICKESGEFTLDRADQVSYVVQAAGHVNSEGERDSTLTIDATHTYKARNHDGTEVIKQTVKYKAGDIVAANVYEQISGLVEGSNIRTIDNSNISNYFDPKQDVPATLKAMDGTVLGSTWDDIDIHIGDNSGMNTPGAPFYGGGGIYGGCHALNNTGTSLSGTYTQLACADGYGGNSTIMIGDDPNGTKEHISIGTGHYVKQNLKAGQDDKIGSYLKEEIKDASGTGTGKYRFVHQASGTVESGKEYYAMETEGGVFGDGARTFVQNFRAVDITGYGYSEHTPLTAKLINTFQRIDLLSLNDCCLQLQGAVDYATNMIDDTQYSIARIGEIRMNSSLNDLATLTDKRNYMGFSKNVHFLGALYSNTDFTSGFRGTGGAKETKSYKDVKKEYIAAYENATNKTDEVIKAFKKRNLGTSPNMVGINNGNTLKIQNVFTTNATNSATDTNLKFESKNNFYYGPIVGVVEVKLLTAQEGEGGGYIYAFNQHEDKASPATGKTFLEDTGNFVFASPVETATTRAEGETTKTYIVDDCYPIGYYANNDHATDEEIHYWFVEGNKYFFNTTLTGYTYGNPIDFYLDNSDALILLSGITPTSDIEVQSITWRDHDDGYKSALKDNLNDTGTDSRSNYQLLLTIDSDTENAYTLANPANAFVAQIPNGNAPDAYGTGTGGAIQVNANYSDKPSNVKNTPLLGIHLHDEDTENIKPGFYKEHLSEDDYVVIKLKAKDSNGEENFYTINLTISYLQGPYINGKVNIENCALPGEYIYANTDSITMEMDDALTVTGMKWYLYPKQKRPGVNDYYWDNTLNGKVDVTKYVQQGVSGNRLQLPARYYQNDWQLDFVVVVNGQPFGLTNSAMDVPRLTVHNYHRMSTVAKAVKQFGTTDTDYGYNLDLDLVGGALVYIESDEDFEIFTKYVNYCNSYRTSIANNEKAEGYQYRLAKADADPDNPAEYTGTDAVVWQKDKDAAHWARVMRAEVLPGFNRNGGVTGFTNNNSILGYDDDEDVPLQNVKNPSGAENIRFVLTTDIETTEHCMPIGQFRGRLIGNGHTINFKSGYQNSNFIDKNYGELNYVGFVSSGGADAAGHTTAVVFDNYGQVNNCFYYNYLKSGAAGYDKFADDIPDFGRTNDAAFIGANYASLVQNIKHEVTGDAEKQVHWYGSVDNCYQNSDQTQANDLNVQAKNIRDEIERDHLPTAHEVRGKLSYRSSQSFHNGMIAYNLNQEYLKARWKSHDNDALVREQMEASYVDSNDNYVGGDYLYNYYADGDYRYAYPYNATLHPEALRLAENFGVPNYEDYLGNGKTMHKSAEDAGHDERRWFENLTRTDIVQLDSHGQIIYETVGEGDNKTIQPKRGNKGYFPLYMHDADNTRAPHSDFIFFGQRITANTAKREYYPHRVTYDNRVYRASGMYGSRTDYGFHFNREAEVLVPQLTAIDFTGTLDLKYGANGAASEDDPTMLELNKKASTKPSYDKGTPQYKERWQFYIKHGNNASIYANDTYLSYELNAGKYTQDLDGNWSYKEELAKTATDTIIQHIFYPPLLDLPGGDRPENLHNILSFKIDTNRSHFDSNGLQVEAIDDHSHVTKNLLVYTPAVGGAYTEADETNLFEKLHYTRMHRWGDVEGETNQNNIIGHHLRWVEHLPGETDKGGNELTPHFHAANGLFHLVDRQDFNAPLDFYVADDVNSSQSTNGRAWMLRQPKRYSSRSKSVADGFTISKDAWESIALPFTANRVWAVNSGDYLEKYSRGQITHFYGKDYTYTENGVEKTNFGETHHDYWLRGLVETATDTYKGDDVIASADFARPGSKNDDLFEVGGDQQMTGDYAYTNDWFYTAYKDVDYSAVHDEYGSNKTENEELVHEPETILYKDYRYLTKNAPYIIAFPGCPENCKDKDGNTDYGYYEFDLSGNFYNYKNSTIGCNPQEILYEFTVEQIDHNNNFDSDATNVRIPVTDLYESVRRTDVTGTDGTKTSHLATFKRIVISEKPDVDEDLYVLNDGTEDDADANGVLTVRVKDDANVKLTPGSAFINCKDFGIKEILPFRTYLKVPIPKSSAAAKRFVKIGDGALGKEEVGGKDQEKDESVQYSEVNIFVHENNLVITSDHDFTLPLYGISGQLYRRLAVKAGYNVYRGLSSGVYIAMGKKFVIRR